VRTYSSGMLLRLGFAIATAIDPEILLLDEGLGAGDARFAARAADRVKALIQWSSIMVLASHSDELIRQMCKRAILLDRGRVIADGPTEVVLEIYARLNRGEPQSKPLPAPQAERLEEASDEFAAARSECRSAGGNIGTADATVIAPSRSRCSAGRMRVGSRQSDYVADRAMPST
jgi:ABC-type multidrug transport system ATPase subunit